MGIDYNLVYENLEKHEKRLSAIRESYAPNILEEFDSNSELFDKKMGEEITQIYRSIVDICTSAFVGEPELQNDPIFVYNDTPDTSNMSESDKKIQLVKNHFDFINVLQRFIERKKEKTKLYLENSIKPKTTKDEEFFEDEIEVVENSVFVIMPMGSTEMDETYSIIKSECAKLGLNANNVGELSGSYSITDDIIDQIEGSEFIIADLSNDRPNVYYELGYAHGFGHEGSNVLLIAKQGTSPHFDLRNLRVQFYESSEKLHEIVYDEMKKLVDEREDEISN